MKPIKKTILAEIIEDGPTKSGIILKDFRLAQHKAKVLAIGPDVKHLKEGDTIKYDHNLVQNYEHEGKKCVWLSEDKGFIGKLGHDSFRV